jgi:hypothetical protein
VDTAHRRDLYTRSITLAALQSVTFSFPRIQPNFLPVNMVNFHDPAVIEQDSGTYTLSTMYYVLGSTTTPFLIVVLTKLSHAVGGLYM